MPRPILLLQRPKLCLPPVLKRPPLICKAFQRSALCPVLQSEIFGGKRKKEKRKNRNEPETRVTKRSHFSTRKRSAKAEERNARRSSRRAERQTGTHVFGPTKLCTRRGERRCPQAQHGGQLGPRPDTRCSGGDFSPRGRAFLYRSYPRANTMKVFCEDASLGTTVRNARFTESPLA